MENHQFNEIREILKNIIIQDLNINLENDDLDYDTSLYEDGIGLDSISIVNFIVLIEERFGMAFSEHEITSEMFSSINSLSTFLSSKKSVVTSHKN